LGEVHQSDQILPICNSFSFIQKLQAVLIRGGLYRKAPLKFYYV